MQCHDQVLKFIGAYGPGIHINTNEEWKLHSVSKAWSFIFERLQLEIYN